MKNPLYFHDIDFNHNALPRSIFHYHTRDTLNSPFGSVKHKINLHLGLLIKGETRIVLFLIIMNITLHLIFHNCVKLVLMAFKYDNLPLTGADFDINIKAKLQSFSLEERESFVNESKVTMINFTMSKLKKQTIWEV